MKRTMITLLTLTSLNAFSYSRTNLSTTSLKNTLTNLDKYTVSCLQGTRGPNTYPTPSVLKIHIVSTNISELSNVDFLYADSKVMGQPCKELLKEFNGQKNEFGNIPVTMTRKVDRILEPRSIVIRTADDDVDHLDNFCAEVLYEQLEMKVGSLEFTSGKEFVLGKSHTCK